MKIAISVESTHDLTQELLEKYDIKVIPYQINLGDLSFKDGKYSTEEMFELVDKYNQLPKTTALNEFEYTEFFENLKGLRRGYTYLPVERDNFFLRQRVPCGGKP